MSGSTDYVNASNVNMCKGWLHIEKYSLYSPLKAYCPRIRCTISDWLTLVTLMLKCDPQFGRRLWISRLRLIIITQESYTDTLSRYVITLSTISSKRQHGSRLVLMGCCDKHFVNMEWTYFY